MTGSRVFPAVLVRGATGAPTSAAVAAASAAVTVKAAAVAPAAIPPDGARETAEARDGVLSTPPVDWTTARHDQPSEMATTHRRRYEVTPAVMRSGSRLTGMSEAFALLEADEKVIHSPTTGPEADGDPKLPAALGCDLETPETCAQADAGPHGRIWGAVERKEFAGFTAIGTSNWRG